MRIDELIWDEWNEAHIARHGITSAEVSEVVFGGQVLFTRARGHRAGRFRALGRTHSGRLLFLILDAAGNSSMYVITARAMTNSERKWFRSRRS